MNNPQTYCLFLRGINVGGRHKVPMDDLKNKLRNMGFSGISTLQNSGNVILTGEAKDTETMEQFVSGQLGEAYGFTIPVMVRPGKYMKGLVEREPFSAVPQNKDLKCQVTFLRQPSHQLPDAPDGIELLSLEKDLVGSVTNLRVTGTPELMKFLETYYGTDITTRTWKTVTALAGKIV